VRADGEKLFPVAKHFGLRRQVERDGAFARMKRMEISKPIPKRRRRCALPAQSKK
jgi:ribosomal protein S21